MMKFKTLFALLLAAVTLTACSGVEMMPAPSITAAPPTHAAPAQPAPKETPALIAPKDETPNPNPDDAVQPHTPGPVSQQPQSPYAPQPGDDRLKEGLAFVDSAKVFILESDPQQVSVHIIGSLPTPCHKLRVKTGAPDPDGKIAVSVYTVVNPEQICTQVIEPIEISVPLKDLAAGRYTVEVNGQKAGEFTMP